MKAFFLQRMCVLYLLFVVLIKVVISISSNFFFQRMAVVVNLLLVSLISFSNGQEDCSVFHEGACPLEVPVMFTRSCFFGALLMWCTHK